jgi:hypothetical protein
VVTVVAGLGLGPSTPCSVLHPSRRGPLTLVTGVLTVVAVFALWTALMWLGWALVYLPNLGDSSYDSAVP